MIETAISLRGEEVSSNSDEWQAELISQTHAAKTDLETKAQYRNLLQNLRK